MIWFNCEKCGFKITSDMEYTLKQKKCPACGSEFVFDPDDFTALGIFVDITQKLNIRLTASELEKLINAFFVQVAKFSLPGNLRVDLPKKEASTPRVKVTQETSSPVEVSRGAEDAHRDDVEGESDLTGKETREVANPEKLINDLNKPASLPVNPKQYQGEGVSFNTYLEAAEKNIVPKPRSNLLSSFYKRGKQDAT